MKNKLIKVFVLALFVSIVVMLVIMLYLRLLKTPRLERQES
jgi:hypothetical protein